MAVSSLLKGRLIYENTNENLDSIVRGLDIKDGDNILAVAGSGDQAFAMIAKGANVTAIDINQDQIYYVQRRIGLLKNGEYTSFLNFNSSGKVPHQVNFHFSYPGRLNLIRKNLHKLKVKHEPCEYLTYASRVRGFNKYYLSNLLCSERDLEPLKLRKGQRKISSMIPNGGLVYVTDSEFLESLNGKTFPLLSFLSKDHELTAIAQRFETMWTPAVYVRR